MRRMRGLQIAVLAGLIGPSSLALGIGLTVSTSGGWTLEIDDSDLTAGAGSDITDTYASASNGASLSVDVPANNSGWTISIQRNDLNWDDDLTLYVRRVTTGSGSGTVTGGATFQLVDSVEDTFFTGTGDLDDIQVEFRLEGASITTLEPNNFRTRITYNLTD